MFRVTLEVADTSLGELMKLLMEKKYIKIAEAFYETGQDQIPISFGYSPVEEAKHELGLAVGSTTFRTGPLTRKPPLKQARSKPTVTSVRNEHRTRVKALIQELVKVDGRFEPRLLRKEALKGGTGKTGFFNALRDLLDEGFLSKYNNKKGEYTRIK